MSHIGARFLRTTHRFNCCKICVHETLKDWENGAPTRPDCMLRPTCDRVTSQKTNNSPREHGGIRLRDQLHLAARQKESQLIDLCLLGASLLVTSVSLDFASFKKWTCPPDNRAQTFDMSGDILTCLGNMD